MDFHQQVVPILILTRTKPYILGLISKVLSIYLSKKTSHISFKTMTVNTDQLNNLLARLNSLTRRQESFAKEINELRDEMRKITNSTDQAPSNKQTEVTQSESENRPENAVKQIIIPKPAQVYPPTIRLNVQTKYTQEPKKPDNKNISRNLERIIGENLISKIGIIILILGVAIGTKYAIEHDLISPLTRIILGYMVGGSLLCFAIKLKKKYDNFSAVLLSGGMAILYFITFAAYNFFGLIPQVLAFALMVVFTVFTVLASLNYNKQVIAHIGLVGAYGVPFLLSDGSGSAVVLFSYMVLLNIGILVLAFRKYWKPLNYVAFTLTWIIFVSWYLSAYQATNHFAIAFLFIFLFFVSFYITFLAYKLSQKERFERTDLILILANSFIFYGIGYSLLDNYQNGEQFLGLFTLGNAILHFVISAVIYKQKLADWNLFYLISGLVLIFIAIAIPVQLDGNWVTLLWAGQAALLFWIGRTKKVKVYEGLSYAIMFLAYLSLFQDWIQSSNYITGHIISTSLPFINIQFLSSVLFMASFSFILRLSQNSNYPSVFIIQKDMLRNISGLISGLLLLTLYVTFFREISTIFDQSYLHSAITKNTEGYSIHDDSIIYFKTVWLINYSLLYLSALCLFNIKKTQSDLLSKTISILSILVVFIFLTLGLHFLDNLRGNYLRPTQPTYYSTSIFYILFRYISFVFVALICMIHSIYLKGNLINYKLKAAFPILLHITILWLLSSELINWMDIAGSSKSYKLGITILWGIYSLTMIVLGIWKKDKSLRIAAIVLFGITLAKLFLYDIASLTPISKTIVLVSLGILLLIISFLYTKYKHLIFNEDEN